MQIMAVDFAIKDCQQQGSSFIKGWISVYIPYKLSSKVIDWKQKWFYIGNHGGSLQVIAPGPLVIRLEWKNEPTDDSQISDLLGWIADLKQDRITGEAIVFDWMKCRIQPL